MNNEKKSIDVYSIIKLEIEKLIKSGSETAILDSRVLLAYALSLTKPIYTHENINISKKQISDFQKLIAERQNGKPVSRIIKKKNFGKESLKLIMKP